MCVVSHFVPLLCSQCLRLCVRLCLCLGLYPNRCPLSARGSRPSYLSLSLSTIRPLYLSTRPLYLSVSRSLSRSLSLSVALPHPAPPLSPSLAAVRCRSPQTSAGGRSRITSFRTVRARRKRTASTCACPERRTWNDQTGRRCTTARRGIRFHWSSSGGRQGTSWARYVRVCVDARPRL